MSEKKYDLSKVSQATKDEYLQSMMDWHMHKTTSPQVSSVALDKLYLEAEVKPKTAREILEEAKHNALRVLSSSVLQDRINLLKAVDEALKVLP